jgi:hypothetical protein
MGLKKYNKRHAGRTFFRFASRYKMLHKTWPGTQDAHRVIKDILAVHEHVRGISKVHALFNLTVQPFSF